MTTLCVNPACAQPENGESAEVCAACGQPLRVADRYRCQQLLGQGGFGRTYLALDEGADSPRVCVVKQITPARPGRDRFRQEADRLASLGHHPQIPALLAAIDNAQGQFLVQEYIPGPSLESWQPPAELGGEALVRRVLLELLPVLAYIHDRRVIHRDIKPANIIAPPAPRPLVLVDFGAAKALDAANPPGPIDPEPLQPTATVIGSAGYIAPEQALGKAVYASDLFSLGLTCLYLLTGLHPFDLYSVSDDAWVWRPYAPAGLSPALGRVLDRLVNRRLQERYRTAPEALADLRWSGLAAKAEASPAAAGAAVSAACWEQRFTLNLPGTVARGLAISPQGRAIAAACGDGAVRLWDCTNGAPLHTFRRALGLLGAGHRGAATGVAFTTVGDGLVSGGEDGQVIWWRLADGGAEVLPVAAWRVSALAMDADGTLAVGGGDGRIHLWSLMGDPAPRLLVHHQEPVMALAVAQNSGLLVSGGRDRTLRLWALPSGRLTRTLTAPQSAITALACHPQDDRIVSGDAEGRVQVWSPDEATAGQVIYKAPGPITALAMAPSGDWLAIGAEAGGLCLIDLQGQGQTLLRRHGWAITALAFAPDSRMLVSSSADETLSFWCLQDDAD